MRDFSGEVLTCKKKTCEHQEERVPMYLANMLFMTFDHKIQAKAIGDVIGEVLGIRADECVPDAEGIQEKLENALEGARSRPFNCKFIIGQYPQGNKNVLELVHVKQTVELSPMFCSRSRSRQFKCL